MCRWHKFCFIRSKLVVYAWTMTFQIFIKRFLYVIKSIKGNKKKINIDRDITNLITMSKFIILYGDMMNASCLTGFLKKCLYNFVEYFICKVNSLPGPFLPFVGQSCKKDCLPVSVCDMETRESIRGPPI